MNIIINQMLELLKCCIGVGVLYVFARIMIALETIASREKDARRIKTNNWIILHGKVIVILVVLVIGIIMYNIYDSKHSNYKALWIWKGEAAAQIKALEGKL